MDEPVATTCPKCNAAVTAGEKFCVACGADVWVGPSGVVAQDPPPSPERVDLDASRKIGKARKWLMAVSIITLVSGCVFYAIGKGDVEKQIRQAESEMIGVDPETRDTLMKEKIGMTWEQVKDHDRGMVTMLLVINIGLAAAYLGLWFWAKTNPLGASVTALLLFITVIAVNAVVDPKTIPQGILVKIFFIAALSKAISVAQAERKLATDLARARVVT